MVTPVSSWQHLCCPGSTELSLAAGYGILENPSFSEVVSTDPGVPKLRADTALCACWEGTGWNGLAMRRDRSAVKPKFGDKSHRALALSAALLCEQKATGTQVKQSKQMKPELGLLNILPSYKANTGWGWVIWTKQVSIIYRELIPEV